MLRRISKWRDDGELVGDVHKVFSSHWTPISSSASSSVPANVSSSTSASDPLSSTIPPAAATFPSLSVIEALNRDDFESDYWAAALKRVGMYNKTFKSCWIIAVLQVVLRCILSDIRRQRRVMESKENVQTMPLISFLLNLHADIQAIPVRRGKHGKITVEGTRIGNLLKIFPLATQLNPQKIGDVGTLYGLMAGKLEEESASSLLTSSFSTELFCKCCGTCRLDGDSPVTNTCLVDLEVSSLMMEAESTETTPPTFEEVFSVWRETQCNVGARTYCNALSCSSRRGLLERRCVFTNPATWIAFAMQLRDKDSPTVSKICSAVHPPLSLVLCQAGDKKVHYRLTGVIYYRSKHPHFTAVVLEGNGVWMYYNDDARPKILSVPPLYKLEVPVFALYTTQERQGGSDYSSGSSSCSASAAASVRAPVPHVADASAGASRGAVSATAAVVSSFRTANATINLIEIPLFESVDAVHTWRSSILSMRELSAVDSMILEMNKHPSFEEARMSGLIAVCENAISGRGLLVLPVLARFVSRVHRFEYCLHVVEKLRGTPYEQVIPSTMNEIKLLKWSIAAICPRAGAGACAGVEGGDGGGCGGGSERKGGGGGGRGGGGRGRGGGEAEEGEAGMDVEAVSTPLTSDAEKVDNSRSCCGPRGQTPKTFRRRGRRQGRRQGQRQRQGQRCWFCWRRCRCRCW